MSEPTILWPAPGLPALIDGPGAQRIDVLAFWEGSRDDLTGWSRKLGLVSHAGDTVAVSVDEPVAIERDAAGPLAQEAVDAAVPSAARLARIPLQLEKQRVPLPPRTVEVLDIVHGERLLRRRSVAIRRPSAGRLRLAFATDLHVAQVVETVWQAVARHAPDLSEGFRHPRLLIDELVHQVNALADRGDLDLLVLGGDLVDHVWREIRDDASAPVPHADTNLPALLEALSPLKVPVFVIPGNHDYRCAPWRPRVHGLDQMGMPAHRLEEVLRRDGLWDAWPARWSDLDALKTVEPGGRQALAHHLLLLAPASNYEIHVGDVRLLFLATGRDVLPHWKKVAPPRRRLLMRAIPTTWEDPDSEGLTDAQVAQITRPSRPAEGTLLFLHAPLLHPKPGVTVESRLRSLDPGNNDSLTGRVRFETRLYLSDLRRGVFFHNPGPYLRALASVAGPLATFSGHVHRTHATALDRRSLTALTLDPADVGGDAPGMEDPALLLGGPACGQASEEPPGFLLAQIEGGRLCKLERRSLA